MPVSSRDPSPVRRLRRWTMRACVAGVAAGLLVAVLRSCSTVHLPAGATSPTPQDLATRLQADVRHLSETIGERNAYRPEALEASAGWIEERFRALGYAPRRQAVDVPSDPRFGTGPVRLWNIEVFRPGTSKPEELLVVGAHYDTKVATPTWRSHGPPQPQRRGTPGANDNASGVAGLLAIAEHLADRPTARSLCLVAWVNEEPPFMKTPSMGSRVHARALATREDVRTTGVVVLDMIGCYSPQASSKRLGLATCIGLPDRPDYVAFLSNRRSRGFARDAAARFSRHATITARTVALPAVTDTVAWSDDWAYWQEGFAAFCVTDTAWLRSDHYHEISDTWDRLDYPVMAEVVRALARMVESLADDP